MREFALKPVVVGIFFGLAALLAGELHGLAFGAKEDAIQDHFKATAQANIKALGGQDEVKEAVEEAWHALKKAHYHFMGLGAVCIALCILVGMSPARNTMKTVVTSAVGFGAFTYPLFWTLVSFKMAALGEHEAEESMEIIAQAGAGIGFLGLLGAIAITIMWAMAKESD